MKKNLLFISFLLISLISAGNLTNIEKENCNLIYDFIVENYKEGHINYSTLQLTNLTNQINDQTGSDLNTNTVIDYIFNYQIRCKNHKELPASIQFGMALKSLKKQDTTIWEKYKYEIIFFSIILIGIFGYNFLKNKRRKYEKSPDFSKSLLD